MSLQGILSNLDISASGLSAERQRIEVLANNVANANSTVTENGGPYRRQQIFFAPATNSSLRGPASGAEALQGVRVAGIRPDPSPLRVMHDPDHPDADADGNVYLPNVSLPREMVDLMTASRAYEANLKSMQMFRSMAEQALSLLRGGN